MTGKWGEHDEKICKREAEYKTIITSAESTSSITRDSPAHEINEILSLSLSSLLFGVQSPQH